MAWLRDRRRILIGSAFALLTLAACAAPRFQVRLHPLSEAKGPPRSAASPSAVQLISGELPEGLVWREAGRTLLVRRGYEERYQLLGTMTSIIPYAPQELQLRNLFWRVPLHVVHSRSRDRYCAAQAPLRALTLGAWDLVPFNYPCFVQYPSTLEKSLDLHIEALKAAAAALGANLLVLGAVEGEVTDGLKKGGPLDAQALAAKWATAFVVFEQSPKEIKNE